MPSAECRPLAPTIRRGAEVSARFSTARCKSVETPRQFEGIARGMARAICAWLMEPASIEQGAKET
jgi:hypothetical protein